MQEAALVGLAAAAPGAEELAAEEPAAGVAARVAVLAVVPVGVLAADVGARAEARAGEPVVVVAAQAAVPAVVPVGDAVVQAEETMAADAGEWAEAISQVNRTLTIHITNPA